MGLISGLLYEYYHICLRKAWYIANGVSLEGDNEDVQIGRLIDTEAYNRERKHILIDDNACVDFMHDNTVYEVKKSSAEKEAAIAQIKYYLYVLRQKGINVDGELRIPKEKYIEKITLNEMDIPKIDKTIQQIKNLICQPEAPERTAKTGICKKCAFYELCYI